MKIPHERHAPKHLGTAFIAAILACVVLNPLNSSTISVALPVLLRALHTTSSGITWIVSGYYLGSAIVQPVMGKLGDAWGRARFVYVGLALMIVTAIMAPMSNTLWIFVVWRIVQAIGTSMIYPNAIGLLRQYRSNDIGKILGWIGMVVGVAVAVGPTIGGFLIDVASWHAIFWLNIPISIFVMVILLRVLPKETQQPSEVHQSKRTLHVDWLGILFFTSAITAWLLWANAKHFFASPQLLVLILSLVLSCGLIIVELRHQSPIIPVAWFRTRQFTSSSVITVLTNLMMYSILYGLPVFLENVRHFSATQSGFVLLSFAGVMSLASPIGGRYAQGNLRRTPIVISSALLFLGILILCWIDTSPLVVVILGLTLIGMSFAINNVVIQKIVLDAAPAKDTGQASGVYTLLRYLGTILSSVLIGADVSSASGARHLFIVLTIVSAMVIGLSFTLRDKSEHTSA